MIFGLLFYLKDSDSFLWHNIQLRIFSLHDLDVFSLNWKFFLATLKFLSYNTQNVFAQLEIVFSHNLIFFLIHIVQLKFFAHNFLNFKFFLQHFEINWKQLKFWWKF